MYIYFFMLYIYIFRNYVELTVMHTEEMGTASLKPCNFSADPIFNLHPLTKCKYVAKANSEGLETPSSFPVFSHRLTHPIIMWV